MDITLRKFRKGIAAFATVALLATFFVGTAVAAVEDYYNDVATSDWYADDVVWGVDNAILDSSFESYRGGDNTTRAEMFKMIGSASGLTEETCNASLFPDLDDSHWGCGWITALANAGIVSGDGDTGMVRPNDDIIRAEVAKVTSLAFGLTGEGTMGSDVWSDVDPGTWYDNYLGITYDNCVFQGVGGTDTVEPGRNIVRAEGIAVVHRSADVDLSCLEGTVATGALTVSLDGSTPETADIPNNGQQILYSVFGLTASADEDLRVEQLILTRKGLGLPGDFNNVKIYVDGVQKGGEKTVNSTTNQATFTLATDPIIVPAGTKVLVEVRADMAGTQNSQNKFCVVVPEDVMAYGESSNDQVDVGGSFEVCGNHLTTTAASVGTLTYRVSQPSTADLNVGDVDNILTKVRMEMATEAADVERITFKQVGSADPEDFANLSLYMSGTMIADMDDASWEGDFLTFDLSEDPIYIEKGNSKTVELWADIAGGLNATAAFDIYRDWHIEAIGRTYEYGVNTVEDGSSITPTNRNIVGGNIAFALSSNNPIPGDVARGANDHEFMRFNISTAGDAITVRKISLNVAAGGGGVAANISDLKIWGKNSADEWVVFAGPNDVNALGVIAFTDSFDVPGDDTTEFIVTADIENTAALGETYRVDLFQTTTSNDTEIEYSDGTPVDETTEVTGGTLAGNTQTVNIPTVTVSTAATPGDKSYVKNSTDKDLVAFNKQASTADDIKITGLTVTCTPAAGGSCQNAFQSLYLFHKDGSSLTELDGPRPMNGANPGTVVFSFNHTIPSGDSHRFLLRGDIGSAAAADVYTLDIQAATDVTAEDTESNNATVNGTFPTAGRLLTIVGSGQVDETSVSDADLKARILVGGNTDELMAKVNFYANNVEDWYIRKLRVSSIDTGGVNIPVYNNAEAVGTWNNNAGATTVGLMSAYNTAATADVYASQGSEAVAAYLAAGAIPAGEELAWDNGALYPGTSYDISLSFWSTGFASGSLDLCYGATNDVSAGTCMTAAGGIAANDGEWTTVTWSGQNLSAARWIGVAAEAASTGLVYDAIIVDSLSVVPRVTTQDASVDKVNVTYTNDAGDTLTKSVDLVNGVADFNFGSGEYPFVPVDSDITMDITTTVGQVQSGSAQFLDPVLLLVNEGNFEAVGASSGAVRYGMNNIQSNQHYVAKSAPYLTKDNSASNEIGDGTKTLFAFNVEADDAGKIGIKQFAYNITASGAVTLSNYKLYADGADVSSGIASVKIQSGATDCETAACVGAVRVLFDNGGNDKFTVDAGDSVLFELKATVAGSVSTDTVSTQLLNDDATGKLAPAQFIITNAVANTNEDLTGAADQNFIWTDYSIQGNGTIGASSNDWNNGWLVEGLASMDSNILS